jgi:hypothetical protein
LSSEKRIQIGDTFILDKEVQQVPTHLSGF